MDIRKYFSPVGGSKPNKTSGSSKETKKKNRIIDSDEEDPIPSSSKRQRILASDSDDDMFESSKSKKSSKIKKEEKPKKKSLPKPETPKLKPASVTDFFGSSPVMRKGESTVAVKKKKIEEVEVHSDDDFEKTLKELDTKQTPKKPKPESKPVVHNEEKPEPKKLDDEKDTPKKLEHESKPLSQNEEKPEPKKLDDKKDTPKKLEHESKPLSQNEKKLEPKKLDDEKYSPKKLEHESKPLSQNEEKPKPNENSPPNKMSSKGGLASKLSAKIRDQGRREERKEEKKERKEEKKERREETTPHKDKKHREGEERSHSQEKKRKHCSDSDKDRKSEKTPDKSDNMHKKQKISPVKEEKSLKEENRITPKKEKHHSGERKVKEENGQTSVKDEKEKKGITPSKEKDGLKKEKQPGDKVKEEKITPKKNEEDSQLETTPQPDEKKKNARAAYFKFLQRSGPSNPGSKPIPEGAPQCLQGLVFVLTGVLDSLDRDETSELVKKYGGKVTTSVSRNTTYLIVGNEPGESKLKKAQQIGTKQIDEDALLELIRTRPGKGGHEDNSGKEKVTAASKLKAFERDSKGSTPGKSPVSSPMSQKLKVEAANNSTQDSSSPKTSTKSSPQKPPSQSSSTQESQDTGSASSSASSPKTQSLSSQELSGRPQETLMWVDKYKPSNLKNIIGQQGDRSNVRKLLIWLQNWKKNQSGDKKLTRPSPWAKDDNGAFFKCALLSGSPGVGKTTTAHLVCKEAGFDFVELNASDARSKRRLDEVVAELLSNKSLAGFAGSKGNCNTSENHALVMDEVDGMSGNEDRGGVQELIALIKKSKIPIIAMCNDRNHPKIRSLSNYCFDLRFNKPRIEQIRGPMMSVCFREGIKIKPDALDQIIMGSNQDVRQILHHLSMWSANQQNLLVDDMKKEAEKSKKNFKLGPWDVCKKVFSESDHKNMSIYDKSDLFFHDYSIASLFVQENYPKAVPHIAKGNRRITLEQLAKTAESLADGDLVERNIRSRNAWSLLPVQAMYSSVLPGEYMSGHLAMQIEFPKWLGNNSRRNKFDRLMQEIQMHMRLRISGSKLDVSMDYMESLRNAVSTPLIKQGADGVRDAVEVMNTYQLLREDLDAMMELTQWPGSKDPMSKVESKVKAAFTRAYNKESLMSPFAAVTVAKKKKGGGGGGDMYGEEEEEEVEDEEEEDDITKNALIKVKKVGGKKGGEAGSSKGKGRGGKSSNSAGGRGRGRGKK